VIDPKLLRADLPGVVRNLARRGFVLDEAHLASATGVTQDKARQIIGKLHSANLIDVGGIVKISITDDEIHNCLNSCSLNEFTQPITDTIKKSRYINMYKLLKDRLSEKEYLRVAKNQVLIDIQGGDILYQIFTANILQVNHNEEAPFLEFIQRTCQPKDVHGRDKALRAGCGGFGIRNFLTLFLSIELTTAMNKLADAVKHSDEKKIEQFKKNDRYFHKPTQRFEPGSNIDFRRDDRGSTLP